jgi:hypothetical protein
MPHASNAAISRLRCCAVIRSGGVWFTFIIALAFLYPTI